MSKRAHNPSTLALAAFAMSGAALVSSAQAQEAPRGYGVLGYSQIETDQADLGAVRALAGWKLTAHLGLEAEASFGVKDQRFDVSIDGVSGVIELKRDVAAYAVAFLPLGRHVELFARAGYGTSKIEASAPSVTAKGDGGSLNYGVGANLFVDDVNGLRADWTRREVSKHRGDTDAASLSYIRRF